MSSEVLSARATWQNESGKLALKAEKLILLILDEHIKNFHPNLKFITKPKIFNNIYKNFELTKEEIDEIFDGDYRTHGMIPEFLITNTETNISIIGEVKRQNGWVEGGKSKDGRGNADERLGRYFFPGIMKIVKEKTNQFGDNLPIFAIFVGDITRDRKQVRKLRTFFMGYENNIFLFRKKIEYVDKLLSHFDTYIVPMLT